MDCPTENTIIDFLERRLGAGEIEVVEAHIAACSACASVVQALEVPAALTVSEGGGAALFAAGMAAAVAPLRQPGMVIGGRYRLERLLGEGGMGSVWAAIHEVTRQPVALKLLHAARSNHLKVRRRMMREARAAAAVRHPSVVPITDVFAAADGSPVLVMELLEGESLRARLQRERRIPLGELLDLFLPAIEAIEMAHAAGVVHRDLKPDNLFVVEKPGVGRLLRVLDFGLAKITIVDDRSGVLTRTGELVGTPSYMSPEQAFGEDDIDSRIDVWALGVILYECLSGRRPFDGANLGQIIKAITLGVFTPLSQIAPEVPRGVGDVITQMLSVQRQRRPKLSEVRRVLRSQAAESEASRKSRSRVRRTVALVAACVVTAGVLATAGVSAVVSRRHAPDSKIIVPPPPPPRITPDSPVPLAPQSIPPPPPTKVATEKTGALHPLKPPAVAGNKSKAKPNPPVGVANPIDAPPAAKPAALPGGVIEKAPF